MKISVIVPLRNEAQGMAALLRHLALLQAQGAEVLLVDGCSTDTSVPQANEAGWPVLHSAPGRATQMNLGARHATGYALVFLHADTRLPENALASVAQALTRHGHWGRFDVQIEGHSPLLGTIAALMNLRSRWTGVATGDQALFMARDAFLAVGGFPDQPLMEDIEICRRLKHLGPPVCLRSRVCTSGRRWDQHGVWPTVLLMWRLRWAYWRGVGAAALAHAYR